MRLLTNNIEQETERPTHFAVKEIIPPDEEQQKRIADNWAGEAKTMKGMNMRNKEHIVRFITAFKRGDNETGMSYYLMFEWADGGSLQDLWNDHPVVSLNAKLTKEIVHQVLGLAGALCATHYQENEVGIRHGDLKPENILRFRPTPDNFLGTLKLGDWGLAKYHNLGTVLRKEQGANTTTNYGTPLYEPPEVTLGTLRVLGRQYDVWSMGCVTLELMIWAFYGYNEVKRFREELKGQSNNQVPCYKIINRDGLSTAKVRDEVVRWMDHLAQDPACAQGTVMGELLKLVRTKLLVVDLPPTMGGTFNVLSDTPRARGDSVLSIPQIAITPSEESNEALPGRGLKQLYRATSSEFEDYVRNRILDDENQVEDYWYRAAPPLFIRKGPKPLLRSVQDQSGRLTNRDSSRKSIPRQQSSPLGKTMVANMGRLGVQSPKFVSVVQAMYSSSYS